MVNVTCRPLKRTSHPPKRFVGSFASAFSSSRSSHSTICCPVTMPDFNCESTGIMLQRYSSVMSATPPGGGTSGGQNRNPFETAKSGLNFHRSASVIRLSIGVSSTK